MSSRTDVFRRAAPFINIDVVRLGPSGVVVFRNVASKGGTDEEGTFRGIAGGVDRVCPGTYGRHFVGAGAVVYLLFLGRTVLVRTQGGVRLRVGIHRQAHVRGAPRQPRQAGRMGEQASRVASGEEAAVPRSGLGRPQERSRPGSRQRSRRPQAPRSGSLGTSRRGTKGQELLGP